QAPPESILHGRRTGRRTCAATRPHVCKYDLLRRPVDRTRRALRSRQAANADAASPRHVRPHGRTQSRSWAVPWWAFHFFLMCVFFLCLVFFVACLVFFLCLAQPVTLMGVLCLIVAPFCAVNAVGIFSVSLHRLPGAASAENLPWGRISSNVPTGASGTVRNVLLVTPCGLMNVSACNWIVVP